MKNLFSKHPNVKAVTVVEKLQSQLPKASPTEARIAHYIIRNIIEIGFETGASLAHKAAVSEISVSRFLRKAGYKSIAGLKRELQIEATKGHDALASPRGNSAYGTVRDLEIKALMRLFEQFEGAEWKTLVKTVSQSAEIYVTGFQSVRGTAEDFARRLGLARNRVRYLSAHDGMLGEWLAFQGDARPKSIALILIDVVPYAQEGPKIAEIAKEMGFKLIVISDEFCDWAHALADHAIFATSRSGLFLESTVALVLVLNVLVDSVARSAPGAGQSRFDSWQLLTRRLGIF
jgi:DNA-binding MurR/RpiR family transcriptional regulator